MWLRLLVGFPGWALHELTHYVYAWSVGARPAFEWTPFPSVTYDNPDKRYARYGIAYAPTLIGAAAAMGATKSGLPKLSLGTIILAWWWAIYTWPSHKDRLAAKGLEPVEA